MKPLIQTDTGPHTGNCLATAIACVLEVDPAEIPDLNGGENFKGLLEYLGTKSVVPIWLHGGQFRGRWVGYWPKFCVLIGVSPRTGEKNVLHAVVGKPNGYGYEVVHDPHPEGTGLLGEVQQVLYFGAVIPGSEA